MFAKLLGRDFAIVGVAAFAWYLAAPLSAGSGVAADVSGVVLGVLLVACAFLAHEWGHLLAALAAGSAIPPIGVVVADR